MTGTPIRLATLRQDCLLRDHHRCVISRAFDYHEYLDRVNSHGNNAKDDDGALFSSAEAATEAPGEASTEGFSFLEVAHIIPHSFVSLNRDEKELVCIVLFMLNFFC